jgi:20S proteasome subunit beta 2
VPVLKQGLKNIFLYVFRYQGHIGAYLVLGGYDHDGPHLYSVAAHGSTDKVPFTAMGSGMLSATSVLVIFNNE